VLIQAGCIRVPLISVSAGGYDAVPQAVGPGLDTREQHQSDRRSVNPVCSLETESQAQTSQVADRKGSLDPYSAIAP